jgi:hypothetical protein
MTAGERVLLACFLFTLAALVCFWSVLTHAQERELLPSRQIGAGFVPALVLPASGIERENLKADKLAIRLVNGPIISKGNTLVVYCHVPRDERNRLLEAGIADERSSQIDLEGSRAAVTNRFDFKPNTCGENVAYCGVGRNDGTSEIVKAPFRVTGLFCDDGG